MTDGETCGDGQKERLVIGGEGEAIAGVTRETGEDQAGETGEPRARKHPRRSRAFPAEGPPRLLRITPLTIILVIIFIISSIVMLGVINLPVVRDFFRGEAIYWVIRVGLLLMIASLVAYVALREKMNLDYVEGLLEKRVETNRRMRLLLEAGREIGFSLELPRILEKSLKYAFSVTGADMGSIYLTEKGAGVLKIVTVEGADEQKMMFKELPLGKGLVGEAASSRQPIAIDDMATVDERDNAFFGAAEPGSQVIVPLVAREKLAGVLITATADSHEYTGGEKRMLDGLAEIVGLAVTNAELYRIARRSLDVVARQRGLTESVLEEMVAGVITADRNGRIDVFNREAQRLTGFSFTEKTQALLRPELDPDENPFGPLEQKMLDVLKEPDVVKEGEALIMKKDKTLLPISYRVYPLVDSTGVLGAAAVFMEATEKAREPSRRERVDHQVLLRSLGSRIERLYTHPLSRVLDRVRGMEIEEWARSREDIIRILEAGTAALLGLIEDLEQYLSCVTTREWDAPVENDLGELVSDVVRDILRWRAYEGIVVLVRLSGIPPALGYARMIKTALEEVIENATIAASEGDKKVEITGQERNGFVRVEVRDTGPGVIDEAREFMYLPFFTAREGRSGLGLSIARRVMLRLGGNIGLMEGPAEEAPGSQGATGAVFFLEFPTAHRPAADGVAAQGVGAEEGVEGE